MYGGNDREVCTTPQRACREWGFAHVGRSNSWKCEVHVRCPFSRKPHQLREFTGPFLRASRLHRASSVPARDLSRIVGTFPRAVCEAGNRGGELRTRSTGQLLARCPSSRPQILHEESVRVTNLPGRKGLDATSGGEFLMVSCAGGIIHAGGLRAAVRSSNLRARGSGFVHSDEPGWACAFLAARQALPEP